MAFTTDDGARSLAGVRPSERVRVDQILYGILRDVCHDIGLHEGDTVLCRSTSTSCLVLESEQHRRLVIDPDWARFISVSVCDPERRG